MNFPPLSFFFFVALVVPALGRRLLIFTGLTCLSIWSILYSMLY